MTIKQWMKQMRYKKQNSQTKAKQLTHERKVLHDEETDTKAVSTGSEQGKNTGK